MTEARIREIAADAAQKCDENTLGTLDSITWQKRIASCVAAAIAFALAEREKEITHYLISWANTSNLPRDWYASLMIHLDRIESGEKRSEASS
jgi:hypothetical protein